MSKMCDYLFANTIANILYITRTYVGIKTDKNIKKNKFLYDKDTK